MGPNDLLQEKLRPVEECMQLLQQSGDAVVLDIETTGFSPGKHAEIIEIGAVRLDLRAGRAVDKFSRLIKPSNGRIPASIEKVTHITADMVKDADYFEAVLPEFYDYLGDSLVVAHNAGFDWFRFLQEYMLRVGRLATNDVVCTMTLSKTMHPELRRHNLADLCEFYGCPIRGHHRAYVDAKYTASICLKLREELENFEVPQSKVAHNLLPSHIGFADLTRLKLKYARLYQYPDKKMGRAVFFTTNFGSIYYNIDHDCWGVVRQVVSQNIDLPAFEAEMLRRFNITDPQQFADKAS